MQERETGDPWLTPVHWTRAVEVGVPEIDRQHQEVFARINRLMNDLRQGEGKTTLPEWAAFLRGYLTKHFAMEETYMDLYQYPEAAFRHHQMAHQTFVDQFNKWESIYNSESPSLQLATNLQQYLATWLIDHIGRFDMSLGQYLRKHIHPESGLEHRHR